jgi:hypothetical protein
VRFLTPHVSVLWVFPASGAIVENEAHAIRAMTFICPHRHSNISSEKFENRYLS